MIFRVKDFIASVGGGIGFGFGCSGLVPVIFPSVPYTMHIANWGAITGAVVLSSLYLLSVWKATR